jgi:hypothetical protein
LQWTGEGQKTGEGHKTGEGQKTGEVICPVVILIEARLHFHSEGRVIKLVVIAPGGEE